MGYQIALPPRYVVQLADVESHPTTTTTSLPAPTNKANGKTVRFVEDDANTIIEFNRVPDEFKIDVWYDNWDFLMFRMRFCASSSCEQVVSSTYSFPSSFLFGLYSSKTEDNDVVDSSSPTFGGGTPSALDGRHKFVKAVLKHQADCRSQGYSDPEGLHLISRALSKGDRAQAWKLGVCNAEEVVCFIWQEDRTSLPTLFLDYYLDNIHPYLNSPLILLNKIMCDTED